MCKTCARVLLTLVCMRRSLPLPLPLVMAGMNLLNVKLQSEAWVLALVLATMAVVSCALLAGVVIFARRHKLMFIPKLL